MVYFFVLRFLQTFNLIGVMCACVIFYVMRIIIAVYLASSINENISALRLVKAFLPSWQELIGFAMGLLATRQVMLSFKKKPIVGFLICGAIGALHFAIFLYKRRPMIREFKALIKSA